MSDEAMTMRPKDLDPIIVAFGLVGESDLLPAWESIPDEFKRFQHYSGTWGEFVSKWFLEGADASVLKAKPGIDRSHALRHLVAVMRSFDVKHEHKIAGVAFLLSQWFEPLTAESTR